MDRSSTAKAIVSLSIEYADKPAIVSPRLTLSYREMVARAAQSARELGVLGISAGDNVGVAVRDSGEAIVLMLSLWMLGAVPVPIDFRAKPAERAVLMDIFALVAILEDWSPPETSQYASILVDASWTDIIARRDAIPFFDDGQPAPAIISLTSGTTGRPLGIVLNHERLLFRLQSNLQLGQSRFARRLLNPIPVSASGARNHSLSQLLTGAPVIFHPPLFSADELAEAILSGAATDLCVVPTILRGLLELTAGRGARLFANLDLLYCLGAPLLPVEKRRARRELCEHFVEGYSSNVSGRISVLYGSDLDVRPETVGRVLPHVELEIVDRGNKRLPVGTPGIIRIRSPAMALAIYGDMTRANSDRIVDGWAYPGDIGAMDDRGFLTLLGRTSDLIIRGGFNVHPSEVELVIAEHERVKEVAVVGFAAPREGEEIAAFVVPSGNLSEVDLIAHCLTRLASDKRPRKFLFLDSLPRNANGKLLRGALRQLLETPTAEDSA